MYIQIYSVHNIVIGIEFSSLPVVIIFVFNMNNNRKNLIVHFKPAG